MENRQPHTVPQPGSHLGPGQPGGPTANPNAGQVVNNHYLGPTGRTSAALPPVTQAPLSPEIEETQEAHKILNNSEDADVKSARFDVVQGDDHDIEDGRGPASFPPQNNFPAAPKPPVQILNNSKRAQASYATFSVVGGNRYKYSSSQTRTTPNNNPNA